ncbi:hypothetical protein vBKpnMM1_gp146c [Klebsiella phage vB_KpnM_M1]|jgi:hypothetical protein|uniref:Uncharacterized protein n=2 Tax=Slopekvirus TaxID=1985328 RepID=A0A7T8IWD7_9CAUD|nr:hypothetical protein vBKpnMM1_gp146c [Klebsiella phage vB_KpnM_M1]BEH83874.1 hypothetical protein [Klebsiella phage phiKp_3]BEH87095.1 hypothetical protein [Klebsiella phage phiKp_17]
MGAMRNLAFEVSVIDQRIKELHAKIAPLQEEISTLIKEKRDLIELIDQDIINNVKDGEKIPVMLEYRSSSVSYHAATKFFESIGLGIDGMDPDINQYCLRIAMDEDGSNINRVLTALEMVEPFVRPQANGRKRFDLFEHTLSEWDCYWLTYNPANKRWAVETGSGMRRNQDPTFSDMSLKKVLAYICNAHYYTPIEEDE